MKCLRTTNLRTASSRYRREDIVTKNSMYGRDNKGRKLKREDLNDKYRRLAQNNNEVGFVASCLRHQNQKSSVTYNKIDLKCPNPSKK